MLNDSGLRPWYESVQVVPINNMMKSNTLNFENNFETVNEIVIKIKIWINFML